MQQCQRQSTGPFVIKMMPYNRAMPRVFTAAPTPPVSESASLPPPPTPTPPAATESSLSQLTVDGADQLSGELSSDLMSLLPADLFQLPPASDSVDCAADLADIASLLGPLDSSSSPPPLHQPHAPSSSSSSSPPPPPPLQLFDNCRGDSSAVAMVPSRASVPQLTRHQQQRKQNLKQLKQQQQQLRQQPAASRRALRVSVTRRGDGASRNLSVSVGASGGSPMSAAFVSTVSGRLRSH
ncbi:hypothetical protein BOX15_Mlig025260g1 [Macrostomum lignano]|uniref:Uncharacterized protein n=1 Tax=Macrostomum lignano TaxID=282301 RepID=A0A267DHX1_9PLAT|nr:hypothetical protein BOX15_Mlig025260g1 [Macrostomum lignano]